MKRPGARSLAMTSMFTATAALAIGGDRLEFDRIRSLSVEAGLCIGFFTVIVGSWTFKLFEPGKTGRFSRLSNAAKSDQSQLVEWPASVMAVMGLAISFFVSLLCFDTNTVELMSKLPSRLSNAGVQFCPAEEPQVQEPVAITERKPGCELFYRAYSAGLIKNLGDCAPTKEENKALEVCTLRQLDEPYLHYTARQFMRWVNQRLVFFNDRRLKQKVQQVFEKQLEYSKALFGKLKHVVRSAPKASHHVFTNLPYPDGALAAQWEHWFNRNECLSRYRKLAHDTEEKQAPQTNSDSHVFDDIYGQMLFSPQYTDAAGLCEEYTIHWNSPADSCDQLVQNPEGFLKKMGAANEVRVVLQRFDESTDLRRLKLQLNSIITGEPLPLPPPPSAIDIEQVRVRAPAAAYTIVSFQCFMKAAPGQPYQSRSVPFTLYKWNFQAQEVRFPETDMKDVHVDLYKHFAEDLVPGFKYTGPENRSVVGAGQWNVSPEVFAGGAYPLTNLEHLKDADLFLGNEWIHSREDLLQLYPYYHQFYHFIELFRRQYRLERTRL